MSCLNLKPSRPQKNRKRLAHVARFVLKVEESGVSIELTQTSWVATYKIIYGRYMDITSTLIQ